jgi:prephenate dehydratase
VRVAYLGPAGTYTHEATHAALREGLAGSGARPTAEASSEAGAGVTELALATIHDIVAAVQTGGAERGVVPIENSLEGSVNATLDALAFDSTDVRIVGETVLAVHHCLIARGGVSAQDVTVVLSHPQALAQCAAFLRTRLPAAEVRAEASTAEAVRIVARGDRPWAALGPRSAADRYGASVLAGDVEDAAGNETRFAWLARADAPPLEVRPGPRKTALAFWPRESDHAGWLVDVLSEFGRRGVNLTRIESRPRKVGLGEYVFFVDLDGGDDEPAVAEGLAGVRAHVAQLRMLGSFPAA